MADQEDHEKALERVMALAANLVVDKAYDVRWDVLAAQYGFRDLVDDTPRLRRAQHFGDPDYVDQIMRFFQEAYDEDRSLTLAMMREILLPADEEEPPKYRPLYEFLEGSAVDESDILADIPAASPGFEYIDVGTLPDDFYRELVNQINKCYRYKLFSVLRILVRKLLENLVIDLLRKRYGMQNVDIFYDADRGRFHAFSYLLEQVENRLQDFQAISPSFDKDFIRTLQKYRETGNSNAHSIDVFVDQESVDEDREEINHAVKMLVRMIEQTPQPT